jgi:hypothetical protein
MEEKRFFVYLDCSDWPQPVSFESLVESDLNRLVDIYLNGKDKWVLDGELFKIANIILFRIFELKISLDEEREFIDYLKSHYYYFEAGPYVYLPVKTMTSFKDQLKEVTKKYIGNKFYGEDKIIEPKNPLNSFIDDSRIEGLKRTSIEGFDLFRLIKLCEEVNSSYLNGNYFAVGMLCRALKDHIPPIFGYKNVNEILQDGSIPKSDRDSLKILQDNKHIQDGFLHSHIKKKETLATASSVEYRPQIDVLIRMIIEKGE